MQAVHDKAYHLICEGLKQDTITRFRDKILPQLSTRIASENNTTTSNESRTSLISSLDEFKNELPPAFMVAIGSNPGAGKTSLVGALHETFLRQKHEGENEDQRAKRSKEEEDSTSTIIDVVISEIHILPMDGYHRYRSELAAMKNPEEAFRRRGAPFTFNDEKYAANLEQLRKTGKLNAPAFAHSKKDPEEDFYKIDVSCKYSFSFSSDDGHVQHYTIYRPLIIVEGLYCLFDEGEFWQHAVNQFDMKFFLKINIDVATERLTKRHMRAWGISEEEARDRAAGSDRDNGLMVIARATAMAERKECVVLESVDDEEFAKKYEKYSC